MSIESIPLPDTHPDLRAWLANAEPDSELCILRLGGRNYKSVGSVRAHSDPDETRSDIAGIIYANASERGDATYCVCTPEIAEKKAWDKAIRWRAFTRRKAADLAVFDESELVPASVVRFLQRHADRQTEQMHVERGLYADGMRANTEAIAALLRGFSSAIETTNDLNRLAIEALRDSASGQNEMAVAIAKIESGAKRWDTGLQLFKDYLSKRDGEKDDVAKILKQVTSLLGDEASKLQSSEVGKELFSSDSYAGLRNAGLKVKAAIQTGKLVLSPEALARVMPYVAELTG